MMNNSNLPLVSVCIPTYNSEKTLIKTLESVLNQTYLNLEIIVLDNASTDNTKELLSSYINDYGIKYYRNETTLISEYNWTKSIELANGEYIAVFHADDCYKPEMVEKQIQTFLNNPDIGAVFSPADMINEYDEKIGELGLPSDLPDKNVYNFNDVFISTLKNMNFLVCPSAMVKGDLYKELIPFDYDRFKTSSDLEMWFRILEKHPIAIIKENLMCYRLTKSQGTYKINYLRTEKPDFFKVMDYYLSITLDSMDIPSDAIEKYECINEGSNVLIAANHLIKGEVNDCKYLLKKTVRMKLIVRAVKYRQSFGLIAGVSMLISIYFKFWKQYAKFMKWNLYGRG